MITVGLYLALMVAFIFLGVSIAFAIGFAGTLGLISAIGDRVFSVIATFSWQSTTGFTLSAVPLFILMGDVIYRSGLTYRLYTGIGKVTRGLPGGLLQANVVAATIFAASSGSSVASAAAMGPMTYEEEVVKRGYNPEMVLGSLAAGGTLGILIPPSISFIIYGVATDNSVGELFIAGLIPGLCMAGVFMIYIAIRCLLQPTLVTAKAVGAVAIGSRLQGLLETWQFLVLALVVLGSIYGGIATPTEAAAIGAVIAFALAMLFGNMTWQVFFDSALSTVRTTSMIFFILIAANVMSMVMTYYNLPVLMRGLALNLGYYQLLLFLIAMYLLLGMFFDAISMMILTLPFVMPMVKAVGMDPIWFGVVLVVLIEIGLLTPPVGLNLFVIQGVTGADFMKVVRGSLPFAALQLGMIVLMTLFPQLALWLPQLLRQ